MNLNRSRLFDMTSETSLIMNIGIDRAIYWC